MQPDLGPVEQLPGSLRPDPQQFGDAGVGVAAGQQPQRGQLVLGELRLPGRAQVESLSAGGSAARPRGSSSGVSVLAAAG
ncbi:hypothetical protein GXW82_10900 [Streptacidiphilus sp. 4-A2]|nr:hypothetical protein [Streptacidiphilus sp. 4-A2]